MKKRAFGRNSARYSLLVAAMLLSGCAELYTKIPVLDIKEKGPVPSPWERYGAYYIADDLIISVNATLDPGPGQTEFTVFKKIRILNSQGSLFGTIPVWRYTDHLALFECSLVDGAGAKIPISTSELRSKYEASGKVVVPNVTPGSTVTLRMVFTQRHAPVLYEHWFSRFIPVQTGRLIIHTDADMRFTFDHTEYGTRIRPRETVLNQYGGSTVCWKVDNVEPLDSLPYSPRISESAPRVALRINPLYGTHGNTITRWSELAGALDRLVLDPLLQDAGDEIAAKAAEITKGKKDAKTRSVAIVDWVQQNITCGMEPVKSKLTDLLHGGRSDMLLASLLCKELLKAAGVKSDLILTRAHSHGGFDTEFLSYSGCREGILAVTFDSSDYAICPQFTGYPIGTYPADYFDCSGLDMSSYKTVPLPPPRWKKFDERSRITLSLSSDTAVQTMNQSYSDLSTPPLRRRLLRHSEGQQREVIERLLRRRGDHTSLVSFSLDGLGDYDPQLTVQSRFRDNNPAVEMAGSLRYDLSQLLPGVFTDIDSSRKVDVVMPASKTLIDTLEIRKESGMQVLLDAAAWRISDSLFTASISIEQTPSSVLFIREVSIYRVTLPLQKVGAVLNDIRELNRASKVVAIVKTTGRKK